MGDFELFTVKCFMGSFHCNIATNLDKKTQQCLGVRHKLIENFTKQHANFNV